MKMKKVMSLLLPLWVTVCVVGTADSVAFAQDGNGGQVQTNGEITFYEEEPLPSSSSEPPVSSEPAPSSEPVPVPSEEPTPSASSEPVVQKPQGKYPSTGELVKKSLSISGVALVAVVFGLFLYKRRKREAEE